MNLFIGSFLILNDIGIDCIDKVDGWMYKWMEALLVDGNLFLCTL